MGQGMLHVIVGAIKGLGLAGWSAVATVVGTIVTVGALLLPSGGVDQNEEKEFAKRVDTQIEASVPTFRDINKVFTQMSLAAGGDGDAITPFQAQTELGDIIADRRAQKREASALEVPPSNSEAESVKAKLVGAFAASLENDEDIRACLENFRSGRKARRIFKRCLEQSRGSSAAASASKDQFWAAYNRFREAVGLREFSRFNF